MAISVSCSCGSKYNLKNEYAGERLDFEEGINYIPQASVGIIIVLGIVFIFQAHFGTLDSIKQLINFGALKSDLVLAGDYWCLISYMFMHGSVGHIVGNSMILYILGVALEHAYGARCLLIGYFVTGLFSGLLAMLETSGSIVGASGAIFGMLGILVMMYHKCRKHFVSQNSRVKSVLAIWTVYAIVTGFLDPQISNFGHIGGFLAGLLFSFFMPLPRQILDEL